MALAPLGGTERGGGRRRGGEGARRVMAGTVLSGIMFFPRGGSAQVVRAQARELERSGRHVTLVSGSRSDLGGHGDANAFYAGLDVRPVDFTPALGSTDPMAFAGPPGTAPMHPSYEDRPGAADRVMADLDDPAAERQVRAWVRELERAGAARAAVLHLHHLTPLHEAAGRVAPGTPVVGQLHGTELLMLERIAEGAPPAWAAAERWAQRLRGWADGCARLLVAPGGEERAAEALGLDTERFTPLPNGIDPDRFRHRPMDRSSFWRRQLVEDPQGWRPGGGPGSVRYTPEQLEPLLGGTILLCVGRFTSVKRLGPLLRAYARARERFFGPAALVLLGGHPDEWEDEHPIEVVEALGLTDVFLAGWHDHDELPAFFSAADATVMASIGDAFGQVLVEGMACGLPAVAVRALGPATILAGEKAGWLAEPDDEASLVDALVAAVNGPEQRERRGGAAVTVARERYAWPAIGARLEAVLDEAVAAGGPGGRPATSSAGDGRPDRHPGGQRQPRHPPPAPPELP